MQFNFWPFQFFLKFPSSPTPANYGVVVSALSYLGLTASQAASEQVLNRNSL